MNRDRAVKREESDVSVSLQLMIVNVSQHRPSCMLITCMHGCTHTRSTVTCHFLRTTYLVGFMLEKPRHDVHFSYISSIPS